MKSHKIAAIPVIASVRRSSRPALRSCTPSKARDGVGPGELEWVSAVAFYGPGAVHEGHDIVQMNVLNDRRGEGGGIAWLVR